MKNLLDLLEAQAIEFEIDPDFCGDTHKFGSSAASGSTPYRDLEYDFSGERGTRLRDIQIQTYMILPHVPKRASKNFDIFLFNLMHMFV